MWALKFTLLKTGKVIMLNKMINKVNFYSMLNDIRQRGTMKDMLDCLHNGRLDNRMNSGW